jgi:hypothetical protein
VEHGVERVAGPERQHRGQVVAEGGRGGIAFEQVVDVLGASVHPQVVADGAQEAAAHGVAVGRADLAGIAAVEEPGEPVVVLREPLEVAPVEPPHRVEGGHVDGIDGTADGRQATGDVDLAQAVGCGAEVVQRAEAPEGLAEHAPPPCAEVLAERFGVTDDRVGTKVPEPVCVDGGIGGWLAIGGGSPGAALVEHDDPVVAQGTVEPRGRGREAGRAWRLLPRTSLQEQEVRPVAAVVSSDLASEHLDGLAVRALVVEWTGEAVVDHQHGVPPGCDERSAMSDQR